MLVELINAGDLCSAAVDVHLLHSWTPIAGDHTPHYGAALNLDGHDFEAVERFAQALARGIQGHAQERRWGRGVWGRGVKKYRCFDILDHRYQLVYVLVMVP